MKTILNKTILIIFLLVIGKSFGQAKKPSLLIIPSDNWCIQNGYYDVIDNQGTEKKVVDALQGVSENKTMLIVTHRNPILTMVHRVFVLENGQIVADQTPEQLGIKKG